MISSVCKVSKEIGDIRKFFGNIRMLDTSANERDAIDILQKLTEICHK